MLIMKKVYLVGASILLVILVSLFGWYFINSQSLTPFITMPATENSVISVDKNQAVSTQTELSEFEKLQEAVSREKVFEEQRRPHRDQYGIPAEVFDELPAIPSDFGTMTYMFENGRWKDLKYFTDAYFKQPEFYPNFKEAGLQWWTQPKPSSWGVIGWGAYPADIWVDTFPGAEFEVRTFWHASWGIQTYQGFNLVPIYPASSSDQNGIVFNNQDPAIVSKFFDVSFDKQIFLLSPTYPKFGEDWARAVIMKIKVHDDTPKGQYVVGIDPVMPPEDIRTKWLKQYKMMYFDAASSGITINRPHFRLIITVS